MGSISCPLCCGLSFPSTTALKFHLQDMAVEMIPCPLCTHKVESPRELLEHLEFDHPQDDQEGEVMENNVEDSHPENELEIVQETVPEDIPENVEEVEDNQLANLLSASGNVFSCTSCNCTFTSLDEHLRTCHPSEEVVLELPTEEAAAPVVKEPPPPTPPSPSSVHDEIEEDIDNQVEEVEEDNEEDVEEDPLEATLSQLKSSPDSPIPCKIFQQKVSTEEASVGQKALQKQPGKIIKPVNIPGTTATGRKVRRAPTKKLVYHCHTCGLACESRLEWRTHSMSCGEGNKVGGAVGGGEVMAPWEEGPLPKNKFRCLECGNTYDRSYRKLHEMIHRGEMAFECPVCHKGFYTRSNLNIHLRTHSGDKPYCCTQCHKTFRDTSTLRSHQVVHTGERPLQCRFCAKTFSRASERGVHERVHTGERPHVCGECGKSFRVKYCLRLHQRTHSGERPYPCTQCSKAFKSKSVLQHHLRLHSDNKSFSCEFCGKCFKTLVHLLGHKKTHTKPFACAVCGRRFATLYAVRQHLDTHSSGASRFACSLCGASYGRSSALRDHAKEVHGDKGDVEEYGEGE